MKQLKNFSNDVGCRIGDEERKEYRPAIYQMLSGAVKTFLNAYHEMGLIVEENRLKVSITPTNLDATLKPPRLLASCISASIPVSIPRVFLSRRSNCHTCDLARPFLDGSLV
jgi:hypothetical protein